MKNNDHFWCRPAGLLWFRYCDSAGSVRRNSHRLRTKEIICNVQVPPWLCWKDGFYPLQVYGVSPDEEPTTNTSLPSHRIADLTEGKPGDIPDMGACGWGGIASLESTQNDKI